MYILPMLLIIITALTVTLVRNGIGSFVTLGIVGATIYSIPAIVDSQRSLASIAFVSHGLVSVPPDVELVVLIAWMALLFGLVICVVMFPKKSIRVSAMASDEVMRSFAIASAILATLGLIYLSLSAEQVFFFLQKRIFQDTGAVATLWKWTAILGLVSASLARDRKLLIFHGIILFIIFIRGDRTLVAIATAALIICASYRNPKWYLQLRPMQIAAICFGMGAVFLGKSIYITLKTAIEGGVSERLEDSFTAQLLHQFEPLGTFSHLEFVMRTGLTIGPMDFFKSVAGNLLVMPSLFGVSTNLYNASVTSTLAARVGSGIAGNYLAHGYTVGGTVGAALFYFILPLMLRICDGQFRAKTGAVKVFWCCVGAVIAFYIHRNGLDNLFSFVRQLFVVSVVTAALAAALRQFVAARGPTRGNPPVTTIGSSLGDNEHSLSSLGLRRNGP